jgi:DNA-binding GntR family transcriptional regulator
MERTLTFEYPLGDTADRRKPASFRQHAFETIYRAIYDGTLQPTEELGEQELSDWLQMSRQPIRYALLHLAELGLVDLGSGRTPRVAPLDAARANRTLLIGGMYDNYAVEKVVGTLTPTQLAQLATATADVQRADRTTDWVLMAEAVDRFFRTLTTAVGNPMITTQFARMSYELSRFLQPGGSLVDPTLLAEPISALNSAIQDEDRHQARTITRALYAQTAQNFLRHFRQPTVR